jgi:Fur family ferric uptake transcriptional regulator
MLILSVVRHANRHITATEILEEVRRQFPFVDASTVYRTLGAAADLGMLSGTNMGAGDNEFEWIGADRHHHVICKACGDVTSLDVTYLDALATALHDDLGFHADIGHFAIFGLCRSCQPNG